jgi:LPS-assembly lipoprotein
MSSSDRNMHRAARRSFLLGTLLSLTACGFELRRTPDLRFQTIFLSGFKPHSLMADELKRAIASSSTTRVVNSPTQAQVVLDASLDLRDKGVVATSPAGQVQEVQLRQHFAFRLHTTTGKDLIPSSTIVLTRDMSYNESDALAKESEEELLYRAMRVDIASQVMRRLAAVQAI